MGTTVRPVVPSSWGQVHPGIGFERWLLGKVAGRIGPAALRLAIGNTSVDASDLPPVATVRFRDRRTLLALAPSPHRRFGDEYANGRIEVEGDLLFALETAYRAHPRGRPPGPLARVLTSLPHWPGLDRRNIHRHYDLGNSFYRQWLDERMVYTCAYFSSPEASLEQAQVAKMEMVCRKLGLRPGESVVEVGCGWGALALHMAREHGVRVRAYNVSHEQVRYAREQARSQGLVDRVQFLEADYRRATGTADAFVSVGMLEHVGKASYGELARVIARTLDPRTGRGLLHFIGRDVPRPLDPWIRRRIFPGAYAPTLDEACRGVLAPAGMSVIDVENLRPHYAKTLREWRERFERAVEDGRVGFDEPFRRAWRLYLAGSEAAFLTGSLQLFQVLFAPAGARTTPWTRAPWYHDHERGHECSVPTS